MQDNCKLLSCSSPIVVQSVLVHAIMSFPPLRVKKKPQKHFEWKSWGLPDRCYSPDKYASSFAYLHIYFITWNWCRFFILMFFCGPCASCHNSLTFALLCLHTGPGIHQEALPRRRVTALWKRKCNLRTRSLCQVTTVKKMSRMKPQTYLLHPGTPNLLGWGRDIQNAQQLVDGKVVTLKKIFNDCFQRGCVIIFLI